MINAESDLKKLVDGLDFDISLFNGLWDSEMNICDINSYDDLISLYPVDGSSWSHSAHNLWFGHMVLSELYSSVLNYREAIADSFRYSCDLSIDGVPYDIKLALLPVDVLIPENLEDEGFKASLINLLYDDVEVWDVNCLFVVYLNQSNPLDSWKLMANTSSTDKSVGEFLSGDVAVLNNINIYGNNVSSGIIWVLG